MSDINIVALTGNLTRDPELRFTQSGMPVLNFGIAANDGRKNQQTGEWEEYANFIDVTMFGNRAQSLSQYLNKGMKVSLQGKLHWSQWEKDGQKRSKLDVIANDLVLPPKSQQGGAQPAQGNAPTPQPAQPYQPQGYTPQPTQQNMGFDPAQQSYTPQPSVSVYDEDIPF